VNLEEGPGGACISESSDSETSNSDPSDSETSSSESGTPQLAAGVPGTLFYPSLCFLIDIGAISSILPVLEFVSMELRALERKLWQLKQLLEPEMSPTPADQRASIQPPMVRKKVSIESAQHVGLVSHGRGAAWTMLSLASFIPGITNPKIPFSRLSCLHHIT
jgi:hypothetical protein